MVPSILLPLHTRVLDRTNLQVICGQIPPSTLRRFLCEWRWLKHMRYEQLCMNAAAMQYQKSLQKNHYSSSVEINARRLGGIAGFLELHIG